MRFLPSFGQVVSELSYMPGTVPDGRADGAVGGTGRSPADVEFTFMGGQCK